MTHMSCEVTDSSKRTQQPPRGHKRYLLSKKATQSTFKITLCIKL